MVARRRSRADNGAQTMGRICDALNVEPEWNPNPDSAVCVIRQYNFLACGLFSLTFDQLYDIEFD